MTGPGLTSLPAWTGLQKHFQSHRTDRIAGLFEQDSNRATTFSRTLDGLTVDFSRHAVTGETLALLCALADACEVPQAIENLFNGEKLNRSEDRPALHTALRLPPGESFTLDNEPVTDAIHAELDRMDAYIRELHSGAITGYTGKPVDTLVNFGIGGSDLGPRMVHRALTLGKSVPVTVHFVANIDAHDIVAVLDNVDPETTLFVLSSKSCTTRETLTNARTAMRWLQEQGCESPASQFLAVTANPPAARELGIAADRIFTFREWVGGRYSLWSAIGLPLAAAIGMEAFRALLAGAHKMDRHFRTEPVDRNLPVILALLDIWYLNCHQVPCTAVVPYCESLSLLPDHLSQLFMESNGKRVTQDNVPVEYPTSPVLLGGVGTNAQHAFFQLLHQGTRLIPVEFIAVLNDDLGRPDHHRQLFANCLAQAEALMHGTAGDDLPGYRQLPGNNPSTLIVLEELSAEYIGMLIALYEHRVFVQGHIWNINSFDQWGVERGKTIAAGITESLESGQSNDQHDASTKHWIDRYRQS